MNKEELNQIQKLAEQQWEGCHGCDESDKNFWMNGFMTGYLNAKVECNEMEIKRRQDEIAEAIMADISKWKTIINKQ